MLWLPLSCIYCALMSLAIGTAGWSDSDSLVSKWHNLMVLLHLWESLLLSSVEFLKCNKSTTSEYFGIHESIFSNFVFCGVPKNILSLKRRDFGVPKSGFRPNWGIFFFFFGDFGEPTILGVLFQFFFQRFSYRGSSFWSFRGLCWYNIFVFLISNLHLSLLGLFDFESCAFFFKIRRRFGSETGDSLEGKPISLHVWKDLNSRGHDPILAQADFLKRQPDF